MPSSIFPKWAKFKRDHQRQSLAQPMRFPIGRRSGHLTFDALEFDFSGLVRVSGWSHHDIESNLLPSVSLDNHQVPFLQSFRLTRPDVPPGRNGRSTLTGFVLEYLVPADWNAFASEVQLTLADGATLSFPVSGQVSRPHYSPLFEVDQVLHRDDIYGSGPPNKSVNPELKLLVRDLHGKVLDYGCGQGVLVEELRAAGLDAYGIELDIDVIRSRLKPEILPYITLYDGSLPTPYESGSFDSIVCSEVLEHIPAFQEAIAEIARLTRDLAIITVPDASAIPLGCRHGAVPWHLMEATHVNFFNQTSLKAALQPWFSQIEFGRMGAASFNDTPYYVSLVARCQK